MQWGRAMRLAILGTGAMARYYAKLFASLNPVMVGRQGGSYVLSQDRDRSIVTPEFLHWTVAHSSLFDLVIVAVKWPAMPLVQSFFKDAGSDLLVISLMNGMGQEEALIPPLSPEQLMVGVTTDAVTLDHDDESGLPAARVTAVGHCLMPLIPHPLVPFWQQQLKDLGLWGSWKFLSAEAVRRERWVKLIQNSIINPLTALANVTNGEITRIPLWTLSRSLLEEARKVSHAIGMALPSDLDFRVSQLCQMTASNKSSMLQDIERRRMTEIDAINGYIIRTARTVSLQAPTHEALTQLIHAMETHFDAS